MPDGTIGMIHYCDHDRWLGSLIVNPGEEEPVSVCFDDGNNMCLAADNADIDEYRVWLGADPDVGEYYSRMKGFSVRSLSNNVGLVCCRQGEPVFEVCFDDQGGLDHVRYGNDLENVFAPEEQVTEDKGNKVCRYSCRVSSDPDADSDDYQILRTRTYDLNGRLISYMYESSSGLPYDEPFICCTYTYDEEGNLSYKYRKTDYSEYEAYFDENGQLSALHDISMGCNFLYSYNIDGTLSVILLDTEDRWSGLSEMMTAGEFIRKVQNSSREAYPGMIIAKYDQDAGTYMMDNRISNMGSLNSIHPVPSDTIRPCLELDIYTYEGETVTGKQVRRNIPDKYGFYTKACEEKVSYDSNGNENIEETKETDLFSAAENADGSYRIYENEETGLCYVLAEAKAPAGEAEFSPGKIVSVSDTLNETIVSLTGKNEE